MMKLPSELFSMNAEICLRKTSIPGLHYPVENIFLSLSVFMTVEAMLVDYQDLEKVRIMKALEFPARFAIIKRIETLAA
jgi:uncharacterized protein (DUF433 family)